MAGRELLAISVALAMLTVGLAPTAASQSTTLVVDDDGAQCPNAGYSEIQNAVDDASTGDTVEVCPGTYDAPVVVNKAIDLIGTRAELVTITDMGEPSDLSDVGALVSLGDEPAETPGLTFEGFTVAATPGTQASGWVRLSLVRAWASGTADEAVTIRDNILRSGGHDNVAGIVTNGGPGYLNITGNAVLGNTPEADDSGLAYGVFLNGGHHTAIADNAMRRITFSGIGLGEGADNHAFQSTKPHHIAIESNTMVDVATNEEFDGGNSLWDVAFHLNNGAHDVSIKDNDIRRVDGAVMKIHDRGATDLSEVALTHNEFTNTTSGVHNPFTPSPTIDATENWWGSPLGPDEDDNTGNVDDSNHCLTPTCTIQKLT